MLESLHFIVIEDKDEDRDEVLNELASAKLDPAKKLGVIGNYEDAKELLTDCAAEVDVVFLDLNIPRAPGDPRPEDKHGKALLDAIHSDLNRRAGVEIKVIIVSGQDLTTNEVARGMFMDRYSGTLVGIVNKPDLAKMIKASLKRLGRDPIASKLRRFDIDLLEQLDCLRDRNRSAADRTKAARQIAIRIGLNELDVFNGKKDSFSELSDNLSGILYQLRNRFGADPDNPNRKNLTKSGIESDGGWGAYVWRGVLYTHLSTINEYRNQLEHLPEQPYKNNSPDPDAWDIPAEVLAKATAATASAEIVSLAVLELLEWYLPWHEQVYMETNLA